MLYLVASIMQGGQSSAVLVDAVDAEYAANQHGLTDAVIFVCPAKDARAFRDPPLRKLDEVDPTDGSGLPS